MTFEGQYLTYAEYQNLGGSAIGEKPFNLLEFEARNQINIRTQNRLINETTIPFSVKICDFNLINAIDGYAKSMDESRASGNLKGFNSDGYSESYGSASDIKDVVKSKQVELDNIMRTDLYGVVVNDELILFDGVR